MPGATDPRQSDPAIAAWTVASAAAFAAAGAATVTFFEEWGPRGLEDDDGRPFPARVAVQALHELRHGNLWTQTGTTTETRVWAVGATIDRQLHVLIANLTDIERSVTVDAADMLEQVTVPPWGWRVLVV